MNTKLFIYILTFLLSIAQNVSAWSGSGASFKPCDDFDWGSFSYELTIKNIDNNNNWPKYQISNRTARLSILPHQASLPLPPSSRREKSTTCKDAS